MGSSLLKALECTQPSLATTASVTMLRSLASISDSEDFRTSFYSQVGPLDLTTAIRSWIRKGPRPRKECHLLQTHLCFTISLCQAGVVAEGPSVVHLVYLHRMVSSLSKDVVQGVKG